MIVAIKEQNANGGLASAPLASMLRGMSGYDDDGAFSEAPMPLSARAMAARPAPYLDGLNPAQRQAVGHWTGRF